LTYLTCLGTAQFQMRPPDRRPRHGAFRHRTGLPQRLLKLVQRFRLTHLAEGLQGLAGAVRAGPHRGDLDDLLGMTVVWRRREKEPVLEPFRDVAHSFRELARYGVARAAGGRGMVGFVKNEKGAGTELIGVEPDAGAERRLKEVAIGRGRRIPADGPDMGISQGRRRRCEAATDARNPGHFGLRDRRAGGSGAEAATPIAFFWEANLQLTLA
jgi:hypothetical protein